MPYPAKFIDAYNESKMLGESAVLAANNEEGLLTCAIRPAGIFGPGDRQLTPGMAKVIERGQTKFQIGDNTNIFDATYIDNVVHAHLLAGDALKRCSSIPPEKWALTREELYAKSLDPVKLSIGAHRVPTSRAKPQGPAVNPTPETEEAEKRFRDNDDFEYKPITRTKFDPFSDSSLDLEEDNPLQVPGQAFIITNGEPVYFWDFARAMWKEMGHIPPKTYAMPRSIGLILASLAEWASWLSGKEPGFTRFRVSVTSNPRWFNIEKARRVLGYEPQVGLEEGIRRTVEWWNKEGKHQGQKASH
ncbi:erg26, C-3 sterol dehydrogenase [Tulasnella sp. 419]|nr:erg26, C-3 sterol dehydrogenase [Tulasnella sp. 419]